MPHQKTPGTAAVVKVGCVCPVPTHTHHHPRRRRRTRTTRGARHWQPARIKRGRRQSPKPHSPARSNTRPAPRGETASAGRTTANAAARPPPPPHQAGRSSSRDGAKTRRTRPRPRGCRCGAGRPRRHSPPAAADGISTVTHHLDASRWPRIGREGGGAEKP